MNLTFPVRPMSHQLEAHRLSREHANKYKLDAFAFFAEMGCGKSLMCWLDVCRAYVEGQIDCVIVTAGKGSYRSWTDHEIPRITPPEIRYQLFRWDGTNKSTSHAVRVCQPGRHLRIVVMNVEAIGSSPKARQFLEQFARSGKLGIVVDESTLIKNHEATRTKELVWLGKLAVFRRIASGAPVTKNPLDLWGQFEFLSGKHSGLLGFRSFYAFRGRYAILREITVGGGRTTRVPVAFQNLDELEATVKEHSFRILKEDCLDLPPKVYEYVDVEMTPDQRRLYETFRAECAATIGDVTMTTSSRMTQLLRLHQILCGHVKDDDTGQVAFIQNNRADTMCDKLEEAGDAQCIVWCAYRMDVVAVRRKLVERWGAECIVEYHGGVDPETCQKSVERFQAGDARFFLATLAKGHKGITLTAASVVAYYSSNFDLEHRMQSEDRAHRIGQHRPVTYLDVRVPGTIDERVIKSLREKRNIAEIVMGDEVREWLR